MTHTFDALILGAGAAGLLCAIEAGKRGRRVAVLERASRPGKKILISGGGRCNFTNLQSTASPITKKLSASFSATAPRKTFSECSNPNAAPRG
jgi:predicted flavoprotein YhiN